jgi:hypothetical protein
MTPYHDVVQDAAGNVQPGLSVSVTDLDDAPALIYFDQAGAQPIPGGVVSTDYAGRLFFFAPSGLYRLKTDFWVQDYVAIGNESSGQAYRWNVSAGQTIVVPAANFEAGMSIQLNPGAGGSMSCWATLASDINDSTYYEAWPPGAVTARTTYALQATVMALIFSATSQPGVVLGVAR